MCGDEKNIEQESPPARMEEAFWPAACVACPAGGVDRLTDTSENITFLHPSDAGGNKHTKCLVLNSIIPTMSENELSDNIQLLKEDAHRIEV